MRRLFVCLLLLLAAPAGEFHVDGLRLRQAERRQRSERSRRVLDLVLGGEVEAHSADGGSTVDADRLRRSYANDLDVVA